MTSFCLIRKYKDEDQYAIENIIIEATMEKVKSFFLAAVFSEIFPQVSVIFIAVSYILLGIPLKYCLITVPVVIAFLYIIIWFGHYLKANELCSDLRNIQNNYMKDPLTCFFVAEFYGKAGEAEIASLMNKTKKVEYDFYDSREFENKSININGLTKIIVGSIAVTRSLNHPKKAWIRRVAVKKEYRRRRIAYHLLREAINFCEKANYEGIELITTECHSEAKQLYFNEGFKEVDVSHKSYFTFGATQMLFHMYLSFKGEDSQKNTDGDLHLLDNKV